MRRVRYSFLLLALAASSPSAFAQSPAMRAEFAGSQDGNPEVIIDGRVWSCSGNACTARGADARPAVACRKLARKLGPVARFTTPQAELDATALASCNQDRK